MGGLIVGAHVEETTQVSFMIESVCVCRDAALLGCTFALRDSRNLHGNSSLRRKTNLYGWPGRGLAATGSDLAEESMSHLLLLLSEFGDNPKYIPYLVDSLWDKSSALKVTKTGDVDCTITFIVASLFLFLVNL